MQTLECVWKDSPFKRGKEIEKALGQNLPDNFPTIDKFVNGNATSIKSLDVNAKTYQDSSALTRKLNDYVNSVSSFNGRNWGGVNIKSKDIKSRSLDLAVPSKGTLEQQNVINQIIKNGNSKGVNVNLIVFP